MIDPQTIVANLTEVQSEIARAAQDSERPPADVALIAVSKTIPPEGIRPALAAGQLCFGENYVQEARAKWPALREEYPQAELHLIGPLQSNKAREAVELFDVIHTLDRTSLAAALAKEIQRAGRHPTLLVQVNTGEEPQKAGIAPGEADAFIAACRGTYGLNVEGLMCIPPFDADPAPHFAELRAIAERNGVEKLSMGMSDDFEIAIAEGATSVRVGSALFGARGSAH